MENNILEVEYAEQPISVYQAIGLIDCNISAQGNGTHFRKIYGVTLECPFPNTCNLKL